MKFYENKELCAKCGGKCCKHMGCELFPEDVEKHYGSITEETIFKLLESGNWAVDWYDGFRKNGKFYERGYYMRARNVSEPAVHPSWGGKCVLLTEAGCRLDFEHRPSGGKALKPGEKNCTRSLNKYDIAEMWFPYREIIYKAIRKYNNN